MRLTKVIATVLAALACSHCAMPDAAQSPLAQVGPRPFYLVSDMDSGPLKKRLQACGNHTFRRTEMSIGHRGAPLQFPEHTRESYEAAVVMGAGIVECDVTFTKDQVLVCRHSQCDLHTTTDILSRPSLARKCTTPFTPANPATGEPVKVKCCTSDLTAAEFKTLVGKMDSANPMATSVEEYMNATPRWQTDLYTQRGTLMTHAESIALFRSLGVKMTPELKQPSVAMPFDGFTQADYAQKLIDEYVNAGVAPEDVWPQSFNPQDIEYWLRHTPAFGGQAVLLEGRYADPRFAAIAPHQWQPSMEALRKQGVTTIAPPLWLLLSTNDEGELIPSRYARQARQAGLAIIAWTVERSGPLAEGGDWYFQGLDAAVDNDGDVMKVIDVLVRDVGVIGIFSDWPATVSYYANCISGSD